MEGTKIQWTAWRDAQGNFQPGYTFNPWIGCTEVSPSCDHCYAAALDRKRFSKTLGAATAQNPISHWGKGAPRHLTSDTYWKSPRQWAKRARAEKPMDRPRVFCASLADWLDDEVPIEWLWRLLTLIRETPELDWLLLTKRPENWNKRLREVAVYVQNREPQGDHYSDSGWKLADRWLDWNGVFVNPPPDNIWFGVTVENQAEADRRIPIALSIPAKVRFLSCEPLLDEVALSLVTNPKSWKFINCLRPSGIRDWKIDWVIVGGESGPEARPTNVGHLRSVLNQCLAFGVPVFVKQLGKLPYRIEPFWSGADFGIKCAREIPITDPHGSDPAFWPEALRVRQFPELKTT